MNTATKDDLSSSCVTPADGNLFADLGFEAEQAASLLAAADARIDGARAARAPQAVLAG